ncbi:SCP1.201-like deaminase [Saccharothrix sp. BKS2]|uniref:DddA-like double-stranded DNA deaminase toxin n=1 Tax=Saccharothrix sp. BKS2 TaxID=3064400 RepID=UPI0039E84698
MSTELVQSGQELDGTHQQVAGHLRSIGFPAALRGRVTMGEHVEGKVAWRQRNSGVGHVELMVNNEMCQGMYSCRKLVPFILRPGQTLVIHDPVTSRVFHGRSPS